MLYIWSTQSSVWGATAGFSGEYVTRRCHLFLCLTSRAPVNQHPDVSALNAQRIVSCMCINLMALASDLHIERALFLFNCSRMVCAFQQKTCWSMGVKRVH